MEKHRIGGQGGLGYDIKDAVTDLNMEPNETSTGRKIPVSTITFNTKDSADEFVLKTREEMRAVYGVIIVPGEEYHQVGKYTRLPEKFKQQHGQPDHRGIAPASRAPAGNYAAAVRGEGGGATTAVENRLQMVTTDQRAQSQKMKGLEDAFSALESRVVAQVSHLVSRQVEKSLGNLLDEAVEKKMDARLSDGLQGVQAASLALVNSEMDKRMQATTDRALQKQRQDNQDMLASQAAVMLAMEERMAAQAEI